MLLGSTHGCWRTHGGDVEVLGAGAKAFEGHLQHHGFGALQQQVHG